MEQQENSTRSTSDVPKAAADGANLISLESTLEAPALEAPAQPAPATAADMPPAVDDEQVAASTSAATDMPEAAAAAAAAAEEEVTTPADVVDTANVSAQLMAKAEPEAAPEAAGDADDFTAAGDAAAAVEDDTAAGGAAAADDEDDDDDDGFGDFDSAPPMTAAPAAAAADAAAADEDDEFGDFSAEPLPPAPAPAATPAVQVAAAETVDLLSLHGDAFKSAVAEKWAAAFGAPVASATLQASDLQLLQAKQQEVASLAASQAGSVMSYGGVPLEAAGSRANSQGPTGSLPHPSAPAGYQPVVKCSHELSWRHSASEARLLQSLGLQEAAAHAAVVEAAAAASNKGSKRYGSAAALTPYALRVTSARVGLADAVREQARSLGGSEADVQTW